MSAHALYVTAAYGISFLVLAGLVGWIISVRWSLGREVTELERSGVRRRSEAKKDAPAS